MEGSGIVVSVGSDVTSFRVGDEVFAAVMDKPAFRTPTPGFLAEYVVVEERFLLHKPPNVSFEEAASMVGSTVTAIQTIRRGMQLAGLESLEGKTVLVPAALGATGSIAIQVAKRVFGADKVISTVSTAKMALVETRLPGMVDQLIDYQTQRLQDEVPAGSVSLMLNTNWATLDDGIPLVDPNNGVIISIASVPGKETVREIIGADRFSWWLGLVLDLAQVLYWWKLRGTNIRYEFVSGSLHIREDLERAGELVALGKVKPVVRVAGFDDLDAVREGCEQTRSGKGGTGKFVIRVA
jgi:NADPH:quinone reductase-like Zn-dependent oxidoreductase